jgi:hypothetical protein
VIEDELRDLLTARAASVPDNPTRLTEVRSRVRTIRRRRGVGAVLALMLLAVAGAVLTRLPGRPDALPPADRNVPAPPYFTEDGQARALIGYQLPVTATFSGPAPAFTTVSPLVNPDTRWLLTVRCTRPGALGVRPRDGGGSVEVPCGTRTGDHYEGRLDLEPDAAARLFGGLGVVILTPSTAGSWALGTQEAMFPDRLPPVERVGQRPLLEGPEHPEGGLVSVVVPRGLVLQIQVQCVRGVALRFLAGGAELAVARCEPEPAIDNGRFSVLVPPDRVTQLGLRAGERVSLDVRPDGGPAGQWRVINAGG